MFHEVENYSVRCRIRRRTVVDNRVGEEVKLAPTRVVYDRVRKRKNYFEIPAFLQIERGKSRAGNSKSK